MTPSSKEYVITKDRIVVVKGTVRQMKLQYRKTGGMQAGFELWYSPTAKVGDKLKRFHE